MPSLALTLIMNIRSTPIHGSARTSLVGSPVLGWQTRPLERTNQSGTTIAFESSARRAASLAESATVPSAAAPPAPAALPASPEAWTGLWCSNTVRTRFTTSAMAGERGAESSRWRRSCASGPSARRVITT